MRAPRGKAAGGKAKWGPLRLGSGETAQNISLSGRPRGWSQSSCE